MENINGPEKKNAMFRSISPMPGIYVTHGVYLLDLNQQLETETIAFALCYKSLKLRVHFVK